MGHRRHVALPDDDWEQLGAIAERRRTTRAALIREAIADFIHKTKPTE